MKHSLRLIVLVSIVSLIACGEKKEESRYPGPLTPEEALEKFEIHKDFSLEVFAAEPYVQDPVDLAWDEKGNVFIVCMPDYPYQPEPGKERGNIRMLSDTNQDGRIDKSIVFADSLSEATSILPWKDGLIVTAAPEILYLKDTNGDFKADIREVLFTGFFRSNSEAQITSLRFGVDNWIYANNRGQAGEVRSVNDPSATPLPMQGADFRFRLDRGKFELETGPGQFGQTINDWGHRFFTENSIHIQQAVIPWRYTHRHDALKNPRAVVNVSDHDPIMFQETPPPYWRKARTDARNRNFQAQGSKQVEYAEDHFTGASGGTVYAGDAYPQEFYGNIFTAEVAGNLVHRDVMTMNTDKAAYVATRAQEEKEREFIASTDSWFRPVGFTVGPDGYLYVIDYYRQHIETPVSIPDSLKTDMDFMRGEDMGRIYRVVPKTGAKPYKPAADMSKMTSAQLVDLLAHPNQWTRLQAQRLILEGQDKSIIPALKTMFETHSSPLGRLHALYAMEGLNALTAELVNKAMKDSHAGVREHGIILAEDFTPLQSAILEATKDSVARVALQATLSAGNVNNASVREAMAAVIERYPQDPWFRLAILSSEAGSSRSFLETLKKRGNFLGTYSQERAVFLEEYMRIAVLRNNPGELKAIVQMINSSNTELDKGWQEAAAKSLSKTIRGQKPEILNAGLPKALKDAAATSSGVMKDTLQSLNEYTAGIQSKK